MATEASLRLAFARIGEASAADADDALETALKACRTTGWGCDELCAQWEKHKLNTEPHAALTAKSLEGLVAAWDAARGTKRPADGDAPAEKKPRVIDVELAKPPPPTVTKANAKDLKSLPMDGAADATPPDAFDLNKAAQMAFVSPSPAKPAETESSDAADPKKNLSFADGKTPKKVSFGAFPSPPPAAVTSSSSAAAAAPSTPVVPFAERANVGRRVAELNAETVTPRGGWPARVGGGGEGVRCEVTRGLTGEPGPGHVAARYRYMFTPVGDRASAMQSRLAGLRRQIASQHGLGELAAVSSARQETIAAVGRVCVDAPTGKLKMAAVALEGGRDDGGTGRRVRLALDDLQQYALFPGQVVGVEGVNSSGSQFVATKVIEGAQRPFTATLPAALAAAQHGSGAGASMRPNLGGAPLAVHVASGPFCCTSDLAYEPLDALLATVAKEEPDVCVLVGPFVDANHPGIAAGRVELVVDDDSGATAEVDFFTLFQVKVAARLEALVQDGLRTQFVLVPSVNDVFHENVYPQPPFSDPSGGPTANPWYPEEDVFTLGLSEHQGQIHCVSNPALFRVNETVFGVTSTDVLGDLSAAALHKSAGHRMARLAEHLLEQQSFYPLYPAPDNVPLDLKHQDRWRMPITPDVLVLPSKLAKFAKVVKGCVVVNPGALCQGDSGGTFAKLDIKGMDLEALEKMDKDVAVAHGVAERARVEVVRI